MLQKKTYAFLGAGFPNILQSIIEKKKKNKVLIFEKNFFLGGAWSKYEDKKTGIATENAIHYLLYDNRGVQFIKKILKLELIETKKKFRIINFFKTRIKLPFNNIFSKVITVIKSIVINFSFSFYNLNKSFYFKHGSLKLLEKFTNLAKKNRVNIKYNTEIKTIVLDKINKKVELIDQNKKKFFADHLVITNSSNFNHIKFKTDNKSYKKFYFEKRKLYRPAAHLFFDCNFKNENQEMIFENDSIIKHCHDVTRFSRFKTNSLKVIVVSFRPEALLKKKDFLKKYVLKVLIELKVISIKSQLLKINFNKNYLPVLSKKSLKNISFNSNGLISFLQTEDFCKCMGDYFKNWKNINEY